MTDHPDDCAICTESQRRLDAQPALPPIERLQVVEIQPGDTIVATLVPFITAEQAKRIEAGLRKFFPANRVLVVPGGVELSVPRGRS